MTRHTNNMKQGESEGKLLNYLIETDGRIMKKSVGLLT